MPLLLRHLPISIYVLAKDSTLAKELNYTFCLSSLTYLIGKIRRQLEQ